MSPSAAQNKDTKRTGDGSKHRVSPVGKPPARTGKPARRPYGVLHWMSPSVGRPPERRLIMSGIKNPVRRALTPCAEQIASDEQLV